MARQSVSFGQLVRVQVERLVPKELDHASNRRFPLPAPLAAELTSYRIPFDEFAGIQKLKAVAPHDPILG